MPAQALGVGERLGRIEVGLDADLVLWDGDPLEVGTLAEAVWMRGRVDADALAPDRVARPLPEGARRLAPGLLTLTRGRGATSVTVAVHRPQGQQGSAADAHPLEDVVQVGLDRGRADA